MTMSEKPLIGIIMGSDSDLPVMQDAANILGEFGVAYELTVVSAHRTPERAAEYAKTAIDRGLKVIIAGAGGAAHLAGVTAALTTIPVIGVPVESGALKGVDALYATVQMPPGIPVATVAINGARNAGILAVQILAGSDESLTEKLNNLKSALHEGVVKKGNKLKEVGYAEYLKGMNQTS